MGNPFAKPPENHCVLDRCEKPSFNGQEGAYCTWTCRRIGINGDELVKKADALGHDDTLAYIAVHRHLLRTVLVDGFGFFPDAVPCSFDPFEAIASFRKGNPEVHRHDVEVLEVFNLEAELVDQLDGNIKMKIIPPGNLRRGVVGYCAVEAIKTDKILVEGYKVCRRKYVPCVVNPVDAISVLREGRRARNVQVLEIFGMPEEMVDVELNCIRAPHLEARFLRRGTFYGKWEDASSACEMPMNLEVVDMKDFYQLFGFEHFASPSPDQVNKAYRSLARIYHPDRHPDAKDKSFFHGVMCILVVARETFLSPEKKKEYDQQLPNILQALEQQRRQQQPQCEVKEVERTFMKWFCEWAPRLQLAGTTLMVVSCCFLSTPIAIGVAGVAGSVLFEAGNAAQKNASMTEKELMEVCASGALKGIVLGIGHSQMVHGLYGLAAGNACGAVAAQGVEDAFNVYNHKQVEHSATERYGKKVLKAAFVAGVAEVAIGAAEVAPEAIQALAEKIDDEDQVGQFLSTLHRECDFSVQPLSDTMTVRQLLVREGHAELIGWKSTFKCEFTGRIGGLSTQALVDYGSDAKMKNEHFLLGMTVEGMVEVLKLVGFLDADAKYTAAAYSAACERREQWKLPGKELGERDVEGYDVCWYIRKWLKDHHLDQYSLCEVVLVNQEPDWVRLRKHVNLASVFWSHIQGEAAVVGPESTLSSMNAYLNWKVKGGEATYIWTDYFCLRQNRQDFNPEVVIEAVHRIGKLVACMDAERTYLKRSFCLMESFAAVMEMGKCEYECVIHHMRGKHEAICCKDASTRDPADKKKIDAFIEGTVGFTMLDSIMSQCWILPEENGRCTIA